MDCLRKEKAPVHFMQRLYEFTGGSTSKVGSAHDLGRDRDDDEETALWPVLAGNICLDTWSGCRWSNLITHSGVLEVEEAAENPDVH